MDFFLSTLMPLSCSVVGAMDLIVLGSESPWASFSSEYTATMVPLHLLSENVWSPESSQCPPFNFQISQDL